MEIKTNPKITNETINQRIARFRKFAGYTQEEIAEMLGMKLSTYSQRERKGNVECEFLIKLCEILNVDANILLYGGDPPAKPENPNYSPIERSLITIIRNFPKKKRELVYQYVNDLYKQKKLPEQ